jgi:hypothetical protein
MPSLKIGDLILMALGLAATLLMILLGPGKRDANDAEAEQRSNEAYLRPFTQHLSPVLVIALIVGLGAVAYVLLGLYLKMF